MWQLLSKQIIGDYGPTGKAVDAELPGSPVLQDNPISHDGGQLFNASFGQISGNQTSGGFVATETCTAGSPATCVITTVNNKGNAVNNKLAATQIVTFSGLVKGACLNGGPWPVTVGSVTGATNQFTISDAGGTCSALYGIGTQTESPTVGTVFPDALCGTPGSNAFYCNVYYWEVANTNIHPCVAGQCQGHASSGYVYDYRAKKYWAFAPGATGGPLCGGVPCPLLAVAIPNGLDQHGGGAHNSGTTDLTPVTFYTTNVCGTDSGGGPGACPSSYPLYWWDEVIGVENVVTQPSLNDCTYPIAGTPTATGCIYRFFHNFNTGTNSQFGIQNALGQTSPDGHWAAFPSDWGVLVNGIASPGLGCQDGTTACGSNATAHANGCPGNGAYHCQRGDIFIADLTSAHP